MERLVERMRNFVILDEGPNVFRFAHNPADAYLETNPDEVGSHAGYLWAFGTAQSEPGFPTTKSGQLRARGCQFVGYPVFKVAVVKEKTVLYGEYGCRSNQNNGQPIFRRRGSLLLTNGGRSGPRDTATTDERSMRSPRAGELHPTPAQAPKATLSRGAKYCSHTLSPSLRSILRERSAMRIPTADRRRTKLFGAMGARWCKARMSRRPDRSATCAL